ncbi:hypothetical protein M9H77_09259 [Catharanthus roseus]|uniref:Uncharacterized protein n=1 Tax=Catharanthus roseus TaxID=4058 RepID=A0ACC0C0A5_CATRO|nr:hypothetical protein M9H77_09259 [Catharanthus roseus]
MTTSMLQEVDDIASVMIQEPRSSPSQMAVFAKKKCRQSFGGAWYLLAHVSDRGARGVKRGARRQSGCGAGGGRPSVPPFLGRPGQVDPGHVKMERSEGSGQVEICEGSGQVEICEGSCGGHPPVDPFDSPNLDIPSFSLGLTQPSQSLLGGSGTLRAPPPPGLGFAPFQSPASTSLGFSSFRASPPPGTFGSSTPHQPISQASSSDDEEWTDNTDDVQHLGFKHLVGKKTTRFTPSEWP